MGFNEDDRIRNKNKHHQEAFDLFEGMKAMGFSYQEIINHAQEALKTSTDEYRNDVFRAMLRIGGGLDVKESSVNSDGSYSFSGQCTTKE